MRLIDVKAFLEFHAGKARRNAQLLVEFNGPDLANAAYAILSHCWGQPKDEVQYTEMESLTKTDVAVRREIRKRSGYQKILKSCLQARDDRLDWLWVDTCCIDKRSSAELSEAINSMYVWYANSDRCYAYLHDMGANTLPTKPDNNKFAKFNGWPKWFSRGWTLQELIAPEDVHFFNRNWEFVTRKRKCARTLKVITRISVDALEKGLSWSYPSVAQIMSWAADRRTTREEDRAYSLLGLFGVYMPLLYGEGKNAFLRLQLEVIRMTNDQSIFAWGWTRNAGMAHSFLANDPSHFRDCSSVIRMSPSDFMVALEKSSSRKLRELASAEERFQTFTVTNHGIEIWLPLKHESCSGDSEFFSAILACCDARAQSGPVTIIIEQFRSNRSRYFGRPSVAETQMIPIEFKPILLPYRDNINLNIRGPSSKQSRFRVLVEDIIPSDSVVLVLGNTGSGRSNFINKLTGIPPEPGANSQATCTKIAGAFASVHNGKRFVFIDTPSLDEFDFKAIEQLLILLYKRSIRLTGVFYTVCAADELVREDISNFRFVLDVCGKEAIDRLRLVSTMWDQVGSKRRTILQDRLENEFKLQGKVRHEKFDNTPESAWAIVERLGDEKKALSLQKKMVDDKTTNLRRSSKRN